jgi:molecular chaperone GrpE
MAGRKSTDRHTHRQSHPENADLTAVDAALQDDATTAAPSNAEAQVADEPQDAANLKADLQQASDRVLRLQAELENLRKRTAREIAEQRRYASQPLMRDLLPVLDNIQRAIEAAEKAPDTGGLLDGFRLVDQQLKTVLTQHHCLAIDALNQPFDPHLHEAIQQQPSGDHEPGIILDVIQVGYQLYDRVIRPTQVIVSSPLPPEESDTP